MENKKIIDTLQDIILEEAEGEMISEGFFDRLKGRAAGAWAGAKQGATNAKNVVKGAYRGLKHGVKGAEGADEDIADAYSTSGDVADAAKNAKTETWKKSMSQKASKFVGRITGIVEDFMNELKEDASKLGLDDEIISQIEERSKQLINNSKGLGTQISRVLMSNEEINAARRSSEEARNERRRAARAAARK